MIKLIYSYYKPYRGVLALVLFLSLLTAALDLVFPVLVRHILNTELPQKDVQGMLHILAILFVLYCVNFGLMYTVQYYGLRVSANMEMICGRIFSVIWKICLSVILTIIKQGSS